MRWIYNGQLHTTLTIPFYPTGSDQEFEVRIATEEGESIARGYLCMLSPSFVGDIRARVKGSNQWYRVGGIWNTEAFIGSIADHSFVDIEIKISLQTTVASGAYRLPFVLLHDDHEHGPNRNFCSEDSGDNDPLWGDDEFGIPLWQGYSGGCPYTYESSGSYCAQITYGEAEPSGTINQYDCVALFDDNGTQKIKKATATSYEDASVVGMLVDSRVEQYEVVGAATTQSGQYIYEHGGQEVDSLGFPIETWHDEVRVYDTINNVWRDLGDCGATKGRDETLIVVDGILYIFGGNNGAVGTHRSTLYTFNLTTLQCSQKSSAPTARSGASAIEYLNDDGETEIHFIGGWDDSGSVNTVDYYNIDTGQWGTVEAPEDAETLAYPYMGWLNSGWSKMIPEVELGATNGFAACIDDKLYWFDQNGPSSAHRVFSYPNADNEWEELDPPTGLDPSDQIAYVSGQQYTTWHAVTIGGKLYVSDPFGIDISHNPSGAHPMWIYDPATNHWTETVSTSPVVPGSFYITDVYGNNRGVGVYGTKIYYWGISDDSGWPPSVPHYMNLIIFDTATNTWDGTIHDIGEKWYTQSDQFCGACISEGFLYAVGWHESGNGFQVTDLSDLSTEQYVTNDIPLSMDGIRAFVRGANIYWLVNQPLPT